MFDKIMASTLEGPITYGVSDWLAGYIPRVDICVFEMQSSFLQTFQEIMTNVVTEAPMLK